MLRLFLNIRDEYNLLQQREKLTKEAYTMNVSIRDKWTVLYHCYLTYFISGIVVLMFGVILPYLIEERGLSYTLAGGILSFLAIGNLASCAVYPLFCRHFSEKMSAVLLSVLYPVCLFLFVLKLPVVLLYLLVFLIGITKGMISIVNNYAVKEVTDNSTQHLTLLHFWYSVGALLSPFLFSLLVTAGINWRLILKMLAASTILVAVSYATLDFKRVQSGSGKEVADETAAVIPDNKSKHFYLKDSCFLLAAMAMFCYLGLENSVNGWFVTYLEDSGLMSAELSAMMVSVTWTMIMIGRIIIVSAAKRFTSAQIIAVITIIQFASVLLLIRSATPLMAVISLIIMGLGMAGCHPTVTAFAGKSMGNSPVGMSVLTACGSIGGIIVPQVIGVLADYAGFHVAITFLIFNGILLVVCGILTIPASKRRSLR